MFIVSVENQLNNCYPLCDTKIIIFEVASLWTDTTDSDKWRRSLRSVGTKIVSLK
jgi:hypothetical protein